MFDLFSDFLPLLQNVLNLHRSFQTRLLCFENVLLRYQHFVDPSLHQNFAGRLFSLSAIFSLNLQPRLLFFLRLVQFFAEPCETFLCLDCSFRLNRIFDSFNPSFRWNFGKY